MFPIYIQALLFSLIPLRIDAHTLPVFPVTSTFTGESRAHELLKNLYNNAGTPTYVGSSLIVRAADNSTTVELDTVSGGVWTADNTRLWNTSLAKTVGHFEKLNGSCKSTADRLIRQHKLLPVPEKGSPFTVEFAGTSATQLSREDGDVNGSEFKREEFQLDVSANYRVKLTLPARGVVPIVGGGGNFQFTFDDRNRLIGHHGVWRTVQGKGVEYSTIEQHDSDAQFAQATKNLKIVNFKSTLAYYSAPSGEIQNFLYPVYVYHATAEFGNQSVELRETVLPATTFGTEIPNLDLKPGCGAPNDTKPKSEPGGPVEKPHKGPKRSTSKGSSRRTRTERRGLDDSSWEFGTEWLGKPWGLSQTQANAAGIRNLLFDFIFSLFSGGGVQWTNRFDWGDNLVWETDWNRNDDTWVDSVDLMFYTGHANGDGWVTAEPDSTFVDHSVVGARPENPGDLWGQLDLEWLVVAACGPHQDDRFISGGGNAFARWRGVFDGLHVFLGYGTVTADTALEGARFVKYARGGATLVDSWFRTAKEIQTSGVWVTAMWSGSAGQDHLPGHGSVTGDQPASARRHLMWSRV
ncbi:MAG: hypothetical protein L6R39_000943 [Caloplaca ligustica]|nr:MAG: hypothetical protein L6R39_000943 [Caloplaca ligustica]